MWHKNFLEYRGPEQVESVDIYGLIPNQ